MKVLDAKRGANWHLTLDVSDAAHEERALELAGTFQATLHAQIMSAVSSTLAIALSHMDRGHGLRLLAEKPRLKALWRGLFQLSFTQMNVFELVNARCCKYKICFCVSSCSPPFCCNLVFCSVLLCCSKP